MLTISQVSQKIFSLDLLLQNTKSTIDVIVSNSNINALERFPGLTIIDRQLFKLHKNVGGELIPSLI
jgi:hypothetical protein